LQPGRGEAPCPGDLLYAQTSHGAPFLSVLAPSIILGLPT
jgi:hypothetical protein